MIKKDSISKRLNKLPLDLQVIFLDDIEKAMLERIRILEQQVKEEEEAHQNL